jgi:photosynthetic reaction center cytochrome c subunit
MNERCTEFFLRTTPWLFLAASALLLAGCERPPMDSQQIGFRGVAMEQTTNPRIEQRVDAANQVPAPLPPASPDGPKAKDVYQNVKVLGDLSVGEFTRVMLAISNWVSPQQQCAYCHQGENFAEDKLYTKVVARKMLEMTLHVNGDWKQHVAATGVTCYTCHRGQPVPANVWFTAPGSVQSMRAVGNNFGQNRASEIVTYASLPYDPFTPYLLHAEPIRVLGTTALPTGTSNSIQHTELTYGLMTHMSDGLGVNCTYCHNSRSFKEWETSPPQRATAWFGIRMARELNNDYLVPITDVFPAEKRGPLGDVAKINCATCHNGVNKPLNGVSMLKDYPELAGRPSASKAALAAPPATLVEGVATVFFAVDSSVLADQGAMTLKRLADGAPGKVFVVSGFHSASGTLAHNQELAKQRAFAVRDALTAAGVDAARVQLLKPQQTQANVSGEDPAARRVEVLVR